MVSSTKLMKSIHVALKKIQVELAGYAYIWVFGAGHRRFYGAHSVVKGHEALTTPT
jgi:hypothetical protein